MRRVSFLIHSPALQGQGGGDLDSGGKSHASGQSREQTRWDQLVFSCHLPASCHPGSGRAFRPLWASQLEWWASAALCPLSSGLLLPLRSLPDVAAGPRACTAPSVLSSHRVGKAWRGGWTSLLNLVPDESLLDSVSSSCCFYTRTLLLGNWSETSNPSNGGPSGVCWHRSPASVWQPGQGTETALHSTPGLPHPPSRQVQQHCSHSVDKETEAQRDQVACPEPGSQEVRGRVPNPDLQTLRFSFPPSYSKAPWLLPWKASGSSPRSWLGGRARHWGLGLCPLSQAVHSILGHSARMWMPGNPGEWGELLPAVLTCRYLCGQDGNDSRHIIFLLRLMGSAPNRPSETLKWTTPIAL